MITAGIIGGAGYTAGELIRLLIHHDQVQLDFIYSTSNAGNAISDVHADLLGSDLRFTNTLNPAVDVLFLCLGHGNSRAFLEQYTFSSATKIIDLSNDFRLVAGSRFRESEFTYGLPELNKDTIKDAQYIANPGCFATAIQLAILPLAQHKLLVDSIHVNAVTGATGAGTSLSATTHFTYRDNNFSHYKAFTHQHLGEINQTIQLSQSGYDGEVLFVPNRGNFSRGIFATAYTKSDMSIEQLLALYRDYYNDAPFVQVSDNDVHLKQVVNTNNCFLHLHKHKNTVLITSVIDNLLKGASGQAVQNMNLMFGFKENHGLQLKANFF